MDLDAQIYEVLSDGLAARTFPGAVLGLLINGTERVLPFGRLTYENDSPVVTADSVYDLASVTKSIPTAPLILKLAELGSLTLDDPVEQYVPEMAATSGGRVRIRHLLAFTAVFDLQEPLSKTAARGREAVLQAIFTAPLKYPPGEHYYYSDAPYILLGLVAEKAAGKPLDRVADELFFAPLGMRHTTFYPEVLADADIAPTEITEQGVVRGEANDEKARVFAQEGFVAGHAGLFSTAGDLLRFCRVILENGELDDRRYFIPETIRQMQKQIMLEGGIGVSLAWRTQHPGLFSPNLPPQVFGKSGFTGCMVLLDTTAKRALVMLTNSTYPDRPKTSDELQKIRFALEDVFFA